MNKAVVLCILISTNCYVKAQNSLLNSHSQLQPVQGLYVKPSADGTTGDLFVAASEDNGIRQYLTDQPLNFFTVATQNQPQQEISPVAVGSSSSYFTPHTKRAIFPTNKQYPGLFNENGYMFPIVTQEHQCADRVPANTQQIPQTYPYQLVYSPMVPAKVASTNQIKESEVPANLMPAMPALWPTPQYAYPMQYVMVDPNNMGHTHAISPLSVTNSATVNENDKSN